MELQTENTRTMDTNSYKKYIEKSSLDERTKELFYKMLDYPKGGSKNLERFFKNSESNLFHWNDRTDKGN